MTIQPGRCQHCGRAVRGTIHRRETVAVDYYRTVTGTPRVDMIEDPSGSRSPLRIVRIEDLREFVTCRECWAAPAVQIALHEAWRTGSTPERTRA